MADSMICLGSTRALRLTAGLFAAALLTLLPAARVQAAPPAPAWSITSTSVPTIFAPGDAGNKQTGPAIHVHATNVGGAPTTGVYTVIDTLPQGLTPILEDIKGKLAGNAAGEPLSCSATGQTISCPSSSGDKLNPGEVMWLNIPVEVSSGSASSLHNEVTLTGGGASAVTTQYEIEVGPGQAPFDFLESTTGGRTTQTNADGSTAVLAGSHPLQITFGFGFSTLKPNDHEAIASGGGVKDLSVRLSHGLIVNPEAVPVHCAEEELEDDAACPDASQIGVVDLNIAPFGAATAENVALYQMETPGGVASVMGFQAAVEGVYVHIFGRVNSAGEYELAADTRDILAKLAVVGVEVTLWGDPYSPAHDSVRGRCVDEGGSCPVEGSANAFLSLPSQCVTDGMTTFASAVSWQGPTSPVERVIPGLGTDGALAPIEGCGELEFEPSISAAPTTNLTDSPSGLDFNLHQPQNEDPAGRATANLKEAKVTLPQGISLNPSASNGLGACAEGQIGLASRDPLRFSEASQSCPDAAKIGTVEVTTPLLDHKLPGAIYLAKPYDNPFGNLTAIYLAIEDEESGVIAKLAGKATPDPVTGQLSATFTESPELPVEDIDLHLFNGARAALTTPLTCGTKVTTSTLTPWSTPEGADAHPTDSFETSVAAGGSGACPSSEANAPNKPSFTAGTISPEAGAYSPFVLKLTRTDGTQRLTAIDTLLPKGLAAKFAGIPYCSEAQIAQAQSRSTPNQGALEKASPSCPAASEVGTVTVGAGSGPTPLYVQGHAYLAGPYKGAPLSLAIITPAVAGPFDLGAVVVRTAIYVDPETAQGRAVSDPLPSILQGIPLDVRSIAIKLERPDGFTLNPTSCDPMAITGAATALTGQSAALTSPFQVGGCNALKFKPSLKISLKGGTKRHRFPALRAVLTYPKGQNANIASAQVTLPHSAFLEQGHIGTVCTRVQFAANACPKASIYGKAKAITPLLDQPLEGPVYLRSSSHELPDLVAALDGQIDVDLVGRVDTGKGGGIRNTFEAAPDAPVSKFVLEMKGGKKGLLVNSEDICRKPQRATVSLTAQNGKASETTPLIANSCKGKAKKKHAKRGGR